MQLQTNILKREEEVPYLMSVLAGLQHVIFSLPGALQIIKP